MKKLFLAVALAATTIGANAQTAEAINNSKFWDNWSLGVKGGVYTPLKNHAFFGDMRATFGLEVGKQFSPVFGLGLEGLAYLNPAHNGTKLAIDGTNVTLLGKFNLSNLFAGYTGTPRAFEVEAFAGAGWGHSFYAKTTSADANYLTSKFGLNLLFNLGESKAWTVKVSPAIVYNTTEAASQQYNSLSGNHATAELTAGIVYNFKGSNGAHHFTAVRPYDQGEVDGLNASINDLRGQVNAKDGELNNLRNRNRQLEAELNDCRNRKPVVVNHNDTTKSLESVVTFRQAKSTIDASQQPNVERIATYLNKYKDSKVVIKGYASPEGNLEYNMKLAAARAEAVKTMLVNRYKISSTRITATGNGIGDMFSEPDWNRVSIATIDNGK